jgi:hypothetical protein
MIERLEREVNVQGSPVQMVRAGPLDVAKLRDRGIAEPRKVVERNEPFALTGKQPEAVRRDVRHLNRRSVVATPSGSHLDALSISRLLWSADVS